MATKIEQCSHAERVAALTNQYLELGLALRSALRAAEADLWEPEGLGSIYPKRSLLHEPMYHNWERHPPTICSRLRNPIW